MDNHEIEYLHQIVLAPGVLLYVEAEGQDLNAESVRDKIRDGKALYTVHPGELRAFIRGDIDGNTTIVSPYYLYIRTVASGAAV